MDTSKRPKSPRQRSSASKTETASTSTNGRSATPARVRPKPVTTGGPTHQQIAERAYHIHLSRGGQHGSPAEDWLQAERELIAALRPASPRKRTSRT